MPKTKTIIPTSVETMFTNPKPWKQVDEHLYWNDAEKISVALATRAPNRDGNALNKGETHRAIAGKRDGIIQEAYVVAANLNGSGPPTYRCAGLAEVVAAKLEGRPRSTAYTDRSGSCRSMRSIPTRRSNCNDERGHGLPRIICSGHEAQPPAVDYLRGAPLKPT